MIEFQNFKKNLLSLLFKLLIPYLLLCNHARDLHGIRVPQPDDDDTGLLIEYLTLREVRIE
jgi:hypothetical protein